MHGPTGDRTAGPDQVQSDCMMGVPLLWAPRTTSGNLPERNSMTRTHASPLPFGEGTIPPCALLANRSLAYISTSAAFQKARLLL